MSDEVKANMQEGGIYVVRVEGEDTSGILLCITLCLKDRFNIKDLRLASFNAPPKPDTPDYYTDFVFEALHTTFLTCEFLRDKDLCIEGSVGEFIRQAKTASRPNSESSDGEIEFKDEEADIVRAIKELNEPSLIPIQRCVKLENAIKQCLLVLYRSLYRNKGKTYQDEGRIKVTVTYIKENRSNDSDYLLELVIPNKPGALYNLSSVLQAKYNIANVMFLEPKIKPGIERQWLYLRLSTIEGKNRDTQNLLKDIKKLDFEVKLT